MEEKKKQRASFTKEEEQLVEHLYTNCIKVKSFNKNFLILNIVNEDEKYEAIIRFEGLKPVGLKLKVKEGEEKIYRHAVLKFLKEYMKKINPITPDIDTFLINFNKAIDDSRRRSTGWAGDISLTYLRDFVISNFAFKEKELQYKALINMYTLLNNKKKNGKIDIVPFFVLLMNKLTLDESVIKKFSLFIFNSLFEGYSWSTTSFLVRALFNENKHNELIFPYLLENLENEKNKIDALLSKGLELKILNEDDLVLILNQISNSFYFNEACLYALDNKFKKAIVLFAKEEIIKNLEPNVLNELGIYLASVDKELAKHALKRALMASNRYSTYTLYSSLLTKEEKKAQYPFFEAVAKKGDFLGALKLEHGIEVGLGDFKNLTPEQVKKLLPNLDEAASNMLIKFIEGKIHKLMERRDTYKEVSSWLMIVFDLDKKKFETLCLEPKIEKNIVETKSFRRFYLLALEKENLLDEYSIYRYKGE